MNEPHIKGAEIAPVRFGDDEGGLDPHVDEALQRYATRGDDLGEVLAALIGTRVLTPIVAMPSAPAESPSESGVEGASQMASLLITGADGRQAMLAFTDLESFSRWAAVAGHHDVRPVPVMIREAASSAVAAGAAALVLNLAGSTTVALEGADLQGLAQGWELRAIAGRSAWIRLS